MVKCIVVIPPHEHRYSLYLLYGLFIVFKWYRALWIFSIHFYYTHKRIVIIYRTIQQSMTTSFGATCHRKLLLPCKVLKLLHYL